MAEKTALMFVDENIIKIVVGDNLRCIKFKDIKAPHNVKYIEQMFSKLRILVVEKANYISKDDFMVWMSKLDVPAEKMQPYDGTTKAQDPRAEPRDVDPVNQPKRSAADIVSEAEEDSERMLYRSTDETTMTIDDLYTGEEILVGTDARTGEDIRAKKTLAVHPYRAIDLAQLPEESVKKSSILRRLIRDGTLVPCSRKEAVEMERRHEEKLRMDNDSRLDTASPIIEGSVENFVINNTSSGKFDINAHDAESIEIVDDSPLDGKKGEMSLFDLMKISGAGEGTEDLQNVSMSPEDMPLPRRSLASRPPAERTGIKPKGAINRR